MTNLRKNFARELPEEIAEAKVEIEALARSYGLDFFDTVYVMCNWEEINMLASYGGFPTRYPHWRFGMDYIQQSKSYEYGLSKIYEMVINTDPSYAYLLDNNLLVDQKLVMAHVYGHVDFFKNNLWFAHTNRKMLDQMANHSAKVRRIRDVQGETAVEQWIDICLSLDNLVDPFADHIVRTSTPSTEEDIENAERQGTGKIKTDRDYMEDYINPPEFLEAQRKKREAEIARMRSFPEEPVRDVLGFLLENAPLKRWQHQILEIIRAEAMYFAPQGQTKVMNEGWASFWHTKLMTEHILSDSEVIDFADHNSGTMAMRPGQFNPYKLGVELWRHIRERWDKGQYGKDWMECTDERERKVWDTEAGLGMEKVFQVRRTHNDITFLDEFLTEDFVQKHGIFTTRFDPYSKMWVMDSREFKEVKSGLLSMLSSRGTPRVYVVDANAYNRGELVLEHKHDGRDIKVAWAERTLSNLVKVWGRPVHLRTQVEGEPTSISHDGHSVTYEGWDPSMGD